MTQRKGAREATVEKLFRSSPNPILLSTLHDRRFIEVNGYRREELCEMRTKPGEKRILDVSADIVEFRGNSCLFATLPDPRESRKLEAVIEELSTPVLRAQKACRSCP